MTLANQDSNIIDYVHYDVILQILLLSI